MKFIFPKNYNFKNKLFGFIDYSVAIINILWILLILFILNFFIQDITIKIIFLIIFCFPLFLLSVSGIHGENLIYIFLYVFKFILSQKLFFYEKTNKYR